MERVHQMHVVPDVLPDLHPSLDLRITAPATKEQLLADPAKRHVEVEPGIFLTANRVSKIVTGLPLRTDTHYHF